MGWETPGGGGQERLSDELDRAAMQPLQALALQLYGTIGLVEGRAAQRLHDAVAEIDRIVAALRTIAAER